MATNTTQQTTDIPKFSYPFAEKSKAKYKENLDALSEGNYLFTQMGFWHGGIHFQGNALEGLKTEQGIKSIADGELVAYRINENYLNEGRGFYSTGFFLVRHKIEYPTNNKLTFFSLYMHTAKKDAYNIIQNQTNQSNTTNYYTVKKGDTLGKIAKVHNTTVDKLRQDNNIADVNKIREGHVLIIKTNNHNSSSQTSQPTPSNSNSNSNPNFIVENPLFDEVVILPTPKKIKAGEYLGLMGEYNVKENSQDKCLHLEVFASEEFKTFVQTAKQGDNKLPQSFNWATIIDEQSSTDHISIFENLELVFQNNPSEDLKMNEMFIELFNLIDKNHENGMEPQELKDATVNPIIKDITNNYIVKHSSEWDDKVNMVDVLLKVVNKIDDSEFENKDKYKELLKNERKRIENLSFFTQCKDIEGFPKDDKVYVMNAIGLVNEFNKGCLVTYDLFKFLFNSNHEYGIDFFKELSKNCEMFKIDTNLRKAHFIGQIAREVGKSFSVFENLNYKSSVLKVKFDYFSNNPNKADEYGRTETHPSNQEAIANHAYGNRIGNGSIESGDGWKYRGRGGKQLTGKLNYQGFTNWHKSKFEDVDFVAEPDLLGEAKYAARSAAYFWLKHSLYNISDKGILDNYINEITNIINLYDDENGKKERRENVKKIFEKLSDN